MGAEIALVAGTALTAYGAIRANRAEAAAEELNQAYLNQQAEEISKTRDRELFIFDKEVVTYKKDQKTAFAASGIAGQAPLLALIDTDAKAFREKEDINFNAATRIKEARFMGAQAGANAKRLSSFANNALPIAGSILTTGSGYLARSGGGGSGGQG
jgi:hypothetical protein